MKENYCMLACAVVEHALRPFNTYVPTFYPYGDKHTLTPRERKKEARFVLKELEKDFTNRIKFLKFGAIPIHVAHLLNYDYDKIKKTSILRVTEQYIKDKARLEIMINALDNIGSDLYSRL